MMTGAGREAARKILSRAGWAAAFGLALVAIPASPAGTVAVVDDDAAIVHVLNRLAYGPRPGEVQKARAIGLRTWIDRQLEPERLADPALGARLARLRTVSLPSRRLIQGYQVPREARREIAARRADLESAGEEEKRSARRELMLKYAGQMEGSPRQVVAELQQAKVLRAIYSERQLDEVMADFWLNHFNVFAQKGPVKFLLAEYEREVIRPRAWGRFEDLLLATAESPAMLFYLDNWLSAGPNARRVEAGRRRGLNENYAREIMELHTLGVDGGYTQQDVTEVARCLTGWTIKGLRDGRPEFHFEPRLHDPGDKVVLGRTIRGGGQDEGRKVIRLLATHPSTARFIAAKLARRFVADDPPDALVDRAAGVFARSGGEIRAVVRAIVTSPEFLGAEHRNAKVKTPLEFVASAVRASGAAVDDAGVLARRIGDMGMPLYMQPPPTGYKDTSDAWVSTSGLLARLNFALDLAGGRIAGVTLDPSRLAPAALVPQGLSETTRKTIGAEEGLTPARVAGLVLGSPEFQRR